MPNDVNTYEAEREARIAKNKAMLAVSGDGGGGTEGGRTESFFLARGPLACAQQRRPMSTCLPPLRKQPR